MKAFALFAACGLAAVAGCQVSGGRDVDTTQRPAARAEASVSAPGSGSMSGSGAGMGAGYTMTAEATRDTEWAASSDTSAARGTIRAGDTVMFNRSPDTSMEWQQARIGDGTVRYVRPADFRMRSR